ncbi:VanZ family protein [Clostridium sp. AUH-JLR23]|uniref:VanZ family protein n=1 Tax=Clostridium sp. AUH-JLR23 TaxID=1505062 RepID=UPI00356A5025
MLITQRNWTSAIWIQFFIEIIIFIAIYYYFIYLKYQKQKVLFYRTLLYVYIIGILFVTLLPLDFQYAQFDHFHHFTVHNFTFPFRDVIYHYGGAITNVILNTFMFIPFGFLVPLSFQYSFIKTMLIGLMTIIGIESLQMIFSLFCIGFRTFDITDIITNFIGLCLGYLIYYIDKKRQCFVK